MAKTSARKRLRSIPLMAFVVTILVFVAVEGASYVETLPFQIPLKWHYIAPGATPSEREGLVEVMGNVLRLGNVDASYSSTVTYRIRLTTSLLRSQKTEAHLFISAHPFSRVNGSTAVVSFNGYVTSLNLVEPWRLGSGFTFFRPSHEPLPEVIGIYGSFMRLEIPREHLSPLVDVKLTTPPGVEWFLENIIIELGVRPPPSNPTFFSVGPYPKLALTIAIASLLLALLLWSPRRVRLLVLGGMGARILLAGVSGHLFDIEVYNQYVRLYHGEGVINLGYWFYGPLLLFSLLGSTWPVYALGIPPTNGLTILLMKIPGIASDAAVFILLLNFLKRRSFQKYERLAILLWWLNPFVIYYTSIHGVLYVAILPLLLLLTVMTKRVWASALSYAASLAALPVASITFLPLALIHMRNRLRFAAFLSLAGGFASILLILPYLLIEGNPLVLAHRLLERHLTDPFIAIGPNKPYTWLIFLYEMPLTHPLFNLYVGVSRLYIPIYLAFLAGLVLYLLRRRGVSSSPDALIIFGTASAVVFYLVYPFFLPQHVVWAIPFIILTACIMGEKASQIIRPALFSLATLGLLPFIYDTFATKVIIGYGQQLSEQISALLISYYHMIYTLAVLPALALAVIVSILLLPINWRIPSPSMARLARFLPVFGALASIYIFYQTGALLFATKAVMYIVIVYYNSTTTTKKEGPKHIPSLLPTIIVFFDLANSAYLTRAQPDSSTLSTVLVFASALTIYGQLLIQNQERSESEREDSKLSYLSKQDWPVTTEMVRKELGFLGSKPALSG